MDGSGKANTGGFLRSHTRVRAPLIAGKGVGAIRVGFEREIWHRRDHRTETQFIFARPLLGAYQVVNVRERAGPANDPALRITARLRAVEEPAVASVRRPYAALALEGAARSHGGVPLSQHVFGVVWMIGSDKARPDALLRRHPRVCAPLVAGEDVGAIGIGFVRKGWNRRDHCAKTQFAFAQRLLGQFPTGNFLGKANNTSDVAVGSVPAARLPPHPLDRAIGPHKAIFVSPHDFALECAAVHCLPKFGNFGEKGVMRLAYNVSVSETVVRHPAATGGKV